MLSELSQLPSEYIPAVVSAMVGALHIKFSPIWGAAQDVLTAVAGQSLDDFWGVFFPFLQTVEQRGTLLLIVPCVVLLCCLFVCLFGGSPLIS